MWSWKDYNLKSLDSQAPSFLFLPSALMLIVVSCWSMRRNTTLSSCLSLSYQQIPSLMWFCALCEQTSRTNICYNPVMQTRFFARPARQCSRCRCGGFEALECRITEAKRSRGQSGGDQEPHSYGREVVSTVRRAMRVKWRLTTRLQ